MSENVYRLDLTERERRVLSFSLGVAQRLPANTPYEYDEIAAMLTKLRALEPIGTGGTTEGNG